MHTRTPARGLSTLLCLGALAAQTDAAKKYLLRYAFEEGKTAWSLVTSHATEKKDIGGRKSDSTTDQQILMSQTVAETKDGKARIVQWIDRVKNAGKGGGIDFSNDSEIPGGVPAAVIGTGADMWIDARGSIGEIRVPDERKNAVGGKLIDLEQIAHLQWLMLPKEPVAVGATWETEMSSPMAIMGKSKVKVKNRLLEVTDNKARIEQLMQIDTDGLKIPAAAQLAIEMSGSMTIDLAGWQNPEHAIEMVMTITGDGDRIRIEESHSIKTAEPPKKTQAAKRPEAKEQGK